MRGDEEAEARDRGVPDAPSFAGNFVLLFHLGGYLLAWLAFVGLLCLLYRLLLAGRA